MSPGTDTMMGSPARHATFAVPPLLGATATGMLLLLGHGNASTSSRRGLIPYAKDRRPSQYTPPVRCTIAVQTPRLKRNVASGMRIAAPPYTARLTGRDQFGPNATPIIRTNATRNVLMSSE